MNSTRLHRLLTFISIIAISTMMAFAEPIEIEKDNVRMVYEPADGGVIVKAVYNKNNNWIELIIDGSEPLRIAKRSSLPVNRHAKNIVQFKFARTDGATLWESTPKKEQSAVAPHVTPTTPEKNDKPIEPEPPAKENERMVVVVQSSDIQTKAGTSIDDLNRLLNRDEFFGTDAVTAYIQKVEDLCKSIDSSKNKQQFIIDNEVEQFLDKSEQEIQAKKGNIAKIAQEIVRASKVDTSNIQSATDLAVETLNNRLRIREESYNKLRAIVSDVNGNNSVTTDSGNTLYYVLGIAIIILIILTVVIIIRKKNRQNKTSKQSVESSSSHNASSDNPVIVVKSKTNTILKKQCIDDVFDNPAYMLINSSDFVADSSVKNIYINNSCIKEVYNLYAKDLRNTESPKEDGCMVLGRWVHDEENDTYDVTLEEVIFPGDDAVFKEYELNFGGKIKLRVAERLRKLRRETNLQYDLICWIHSHPGLGVFFSNSDVNVQMQLKHSQHPNFLIAFVVDILTSEQEMGIFTFRKDGSMNSKGDITKMYSLEEMYKWALQSERSSFSHDKYINILKNSRMKSPSCKGVELNNSSIIDLTQIVIEPETGIVGWAVGTTVENNDGQEYVVSSIVRNNEKPGTCVMGCLISMTHMSFPTIQRLIARDSVNLSFVMVYSSKQMTLTTIPVTDGELVSNEQFYGDVNIEDLKIWTRRKR